MGARSKVFSQGARGLPGQGGGAVKVVAAQQSFAFGVIDYASSCARGSCGCDPALKAACPTGGQKVVQRGS